MEDMRSSSSSQCWQDAQVRNK